MEENENPWFRRSYDLAGIFKYTKLPVNPQTIHSDFGAAVNSNTKLTAALNDEKKAIRVAEGSKEVKLVIDELKAMGYKGTTDRGILEAFHEFIGITDSSKKGQLIGPATLNALIVASKARAVGASWKLAVTASLMGDPVRVDMKQANKVRNDVEFKDPVKKTPSDLRIAVFDTSDGRPHETRGNAYRVHGEDPLLAPVREAYVMLGVLRPGESMEVANYRFQILSGISEESGRSDLFGRNTLNALRTALYDVSKGNPWYKLDLVTQNVINKYSE